ncbi:MAG: carboxypeptidase-like regulatory domain-containing protein [Acidobacteriota bacterium]
MPLARVVALALPLAAALSAQTTFATVTGTVTDPNGAVVPGAAVVATHVLSNYRYTTKSNDVGHYTLAQLREGEYVLRAQAAGFKEFVVPDLRLAALDVRRLDVRLELGTVEATVEVSAGATLIETETARISDFKSADALKSLPLNSRSVFNFLQLAPGVARSAHDGTWSLRFAGSRHNQENESFDGITFNNSYDGTVIGPLADRVESFEEVRIDMANNTAEFGAIGNVTIISKSGANQLHGSLFDYYSTPWFRARNPFSPVRGTGVSHAPGGSVGGPVVLPRIYAGENKSFFFFSFETSRGSAVQQLLNPTVPLASWREGDFSALAPATVVRDPNAGNAPFPSNRIPAARINSVARRIQERFYPLPNYGDISRLQSQNYRESRTRAFDPSTNYTLRLDHRFSEQSFVFGRWTWNRSHSRGFEGNLPAIGQRWQTRDTRALNASYTRTLRANLLNEFRWGLAYNDNPRNGPLMGKEVVKDLGIVGLVDNLPDISGIFRVAFSGIGLTGIDQQVWRHPGFKNYVQQYQEHLSWFHGRHSLKGGAMATRVKFSDGQASNALFGSVSFSNRFTNHPYGDFLLGIPTSSSRAFPFVITDRLRWAWDFFITDEFKITPKVTLNLGLRYEFHPSWQETSGRQAAFDIDTARIIVPDGTLDKVSPLMPRGYVDVVEAGKSGWGARSLLQTDRNNLAPRLGLAWRPFGNDTVFRAGYGLFFDVVPRASSAGGAPFVINEPGFTNPTDAPVVVLPRVFPAAVGGPTTVGLPSAMRRDLRIPYSMQYNLTIEHQRWNTGFRVSYIGTNTRQGEWSYNINQPAPDGRLYIDKPRRFPKYPGITYYSNGGGHQYHSLTVEAERRLFRGLVYQVSHVWARDIGDLERGESPENAYDRRRERAVWDDIPTHRTSGSLIWRLPFGRGGTWLASAGGASHALVGGWEISAVFTRHTGQFLTPQWTGTDPTGTAYTTSRTPAQVTIRPDHLRDANLPSDQRSVNAWFDAAAFGSPAPGRFGSSAKGVIKGPGGSMLHTGLAKYFDLVERLKIRWELTATNVMNHPNWDNPATSITSAAQVGVISGVGSVFDLDRAGVRAFRMGLRLEW